LGARAGVEGEGTGARLLAAEPDGDRIAHLLVPAATHLDRHRQAGGGGDGADHLLDEAEIAQAARSAVATHYLLYRAAEVDVDEVRLEDVGDQSRRLAHRRRVGAEDLDADRVLAGAEAEL